MVAYRTSDATVSAHSAEAVTPADDGVLKPTRGLFVGGAGDVKVDMAENGSAITFAGVAAGTLLPIQVVRVYDTDTDATDIVALY